jgi:hypothetical protein
MFRTEAGFKITGRGFVIAGDIIEGTISAGNSIFTHELEPITAKSSNRWSLSGLKQPQ